MRSLRSKALLATTLLGVLATSLAAQNTAPEADAARGGWMGLYIRSVDQDDIEALGLDQSIRGVVVSGIDDDGPAAAAGIEPGDVITEFDGREVGNRRDFMRELERRAPGESVRVTVFRESGEESFDFALGTRPRELQGRTAPRGSLFGSGGAGQTLNRFSSTGPVLGVRTVDLENAALAEYFGAELGEGVLVTDVVEGSGAEDAGIQGGDVILAIGEQEISSLDELRDALAEHRAGDQVEVGIRRKQRDQTVTIELGEAELAYSGVRVPRLPSRAWIVGDDVGDLRREVRELKRDLRRLEREMRRR